MTRMDSVKWLHNRKMLKKGRFSECSYVIDVGYAVQFCASGELAESESKIEALINRLQIKDWDELVAEKTRLAAQVDEYEEKIDDIKHNSILRVWS